MDTWWVSTTHLVWFGCFCFGPEIAFLVTLTHSAVLCSITAIKHNGSGGQPSSEPRPWYLNRKHITVAVKHDTLLECTLGFLLMERRRPKCFVTLSHFFSSFSQAPVFPTTLRFYQTVPIAKNEIKFGYGLLWHEANKELRSTEIQETTSLSWK